MKEIWAKRRENGWKQKPEIVAKMIEGRNKQKQEGFTAAELEGHKKIAQKHLGKKQSRETIEKRISKTIGRKWYNDGFKSYFLFEDTAPKNFSKGRINKTK